MRTYLLGATIAAASSALDVEENLKEKVFSKKQGEDVTT